MPVFEHRGILYPEITDSIEDRCEARNVHLFDLKHRDGQFFCLACGAEESDTLKRPSIYRSDLVWTSE